MPYKSDTENSPRNKPELYRVAILSDISDPKILGFYLCNGRYLRKDGVHCGTTAFPLVPVKDPYHKVVEISRGNYLSCRVRLDEILSERDAPPKHFKLTRITVDVGDHEGLQKFSYLLGARGYVQEVASSYEGDYEVTLDFLRPILVPPTMLLNLIDDCGKAQGWEWEVDTKR